MLDYLLKNGTVYDGLSGKGSIGDVAVQDERIVAIGRMGDTPARHTVDCAGLSVFPGFIDTHTHSDLALLCDRQHACAVRQGITTEIVSPCGLGLYPLPKEKRDAFALYLRGLLGPAPSALDFEDAAGYLRAAAHCAINVAAQLPHGALRLNCLGFTDAPLTGPAMARAQALIEEAARQGVVGFSTGLSYYPATYADDGEVIALARSAARCDLPLVSHCRTVFPDARYDMKTRYLEFLDIAREAGCAVHFSHIKHPHSAAGAPQAFLDTFEAAMQTGLRLSLEMYPDPSGAGFAVIFLPGWASVGGYSALTARLDDPRVCARLLEELAPDEEKIGRGILTHLERHPECLGQTFAQIGKARGITAREALIWLLRDEQLAVGYAANTPVDSSLLPVYERDYMALYQKAYYTIGSDSEPGQAAPHPRSYHTFPKLLRLIRETRSSLAALAQCSERSARIFGLAGRGTLQAGAFADIVVFDPRLAGEGADPRLPTGIFHVLVNGVPTLLNGELTGALPGHGLRKGVRA